MVTVSAIFFRCLRCNDYFHLPLHATRCLHVRCGGKLVPMGGTADDENAMVPWSRAWCERAALAHLIVRQ